MDRLQSLPTPNEVQLTGQAYFLTVDEKTWTVMCFSHHEEFFTFVSSALEETFLRLSPER